MIYTSNDIIRFIVDKSGCSEDEVTLTADLDNDLGCTGDGFDELIVEFAKKFNVDMNSYRWYFHTNEEGHTNSIGRLFFKAPNERVNHIAVTPTVLLESANSGRWTINYPENPLPKRRYDILINQLLVLAFLLFLIYKCSR
jgi:hypothetical protein